MKKTDDAGINDGKCEPFIRLYDDEFTKKINRSSYWPKQARNKIIFTTHCCRHAQEFIV
jgi:hypothetical protein